MVSPLKISVLIPTHRRTGHLLGCLESLARQTRPPDQVVVVVKATDRQSREGVEGFDATSTLPLKPVTVARPGVIAAENAGLAAITGDVVCFTDDDARPFPDWLERIESYFNNEKVGGVGGRVVWWVHGKLMETKRVKVVGRLQRIGRLVGEFHQECDKVQSVDFLPGGNMSYRRELVNRIDENLIGDGCHWEVDVGLSVRESGQDLLYDPAIRVNHFSARWGRGPSGMPYRKFFSNGHNTTYVLLKHLPSLRKLLFLAYFFLVGNADSPGALKALHLSCANRSIGPLRWLPLATRGKFMGMVTYSKKDSK